MGTKRTEVWQVVDAEMDRAEIQWGTGFDDKNTLNDWATYANIYIARATEMGNKGDKVAQQKALHKAIGLLTNAVIRIQDGTIAPRHYD